MKIFLIYFGICTPLIGTFFAAMFTCGMKGWKKVLAFIAISALFGALIAGMFWLEEDENERRWNDGKCPVCAEPWDFVNASRNRNSGTTYYWDCPECGAIIQTTSQMR